MTIWLASGARFYFWRGQCWLNNQGAWRALGTLAPDRLNALLRVATIESIGSSTRIEGRKLSDRDVERLLSNLQIQRFSSRDEQEVAGYAKVMEMVFSSWQDITLTENHIKQLHRDLLVHSEKNAWHRGHYKTSANRVLAFDENGQQIGVVFETATPFDTPRLMTKLVTRFAEQRTAALVHPLLLIGLWVVVLLEVHPFQDGNGRLSRVLTTLLLQLQIVELAREHGRVTMASAIRLTGSNRNTLKQHFRALVSGGQLAQHGAGRGGGLGTSCDRAAGPEMAGRHFRPDICGKGGKAGRQPHLGDGQAARRIVDELVDWLAVR